jgi:hypothetical protein
MVDTCRSTPNHLIHPMSKLLKLKEWLHLKDAAQHLSIMAGEEVTVPDVLRLALDGHLTLSVNLVNVAYALAGTIKEASEARHVDFPVDLSAAIKAKAPGEYQGGMLKLCMGIPLEGTTKVIDLEKDIVQLQGVYDIPMIGGDRLDIEYRFQALTDGPAVTAVSFDGAFLEGADGVLFQIQEHFEDNEYHDKNSLKKPWSHPDNFYPAGGLPDESVLVIRTEELFEMKARLQEQGVTATVTNDGVSTRERGTLLKMLLGMAIGGYGFVPTASRSEVPGEIASDLQKHGLDVSDDTVRKYLKEAAQTVLNRKARND